MKKRRTLIIALLLVAALCLGIGYAAQSGYVEVSGNISNQPHPVKLVFVEEGSSLVKSSVTNNNDQKVPSTNNELVVQDNKSTASFDISDLAHVDDYAELHLVVKNNNNYNVALRDDADKDGLTVTGDATHGDFFSVTGEWITEGADDDLILEPNETRVLKVVIKMTKSTGNELTGSYKLQVFGDQVS